MKSIVFNPDLVAPQIQERPIPVPGPNEVVVKIHAAALNRRDLNITNPNVNVEFVYGSDGSGIIAQVGDGVENWKPGDEVIINSFIACLNCGHCLRGNHTLCEQGRVLGSLSWPGTFSEYVRIPARNIHHKPVHLNFYESAAIPLSFGTAWRAIVTQAKIKPGDTIFIQGIGGGVSLYVMQIAIALGCKVVVSSSSGEKIQNAIEMGAWEGINYTKDNVLERVNQLTENKGFDVIVSSSGGSVPLSMDAAKVGGKIVQFAYLGKPLQDFEIDKIMGKQLTLIGTGDHTYPEFSQALDFIANKKLKPIVSEVYKFEDYKNAFQLMKDGKQFGKIVIDLQLVRDSDKC